VGNQARKRQQLLCAKLAPASLSRRRHCLPVAVLVLLLLGIPESPAHKPPAPHSPTRVVMPRADVGQLPDLRRHGLGVVAGQAVHNAAALAMVPVASSRGQLAARHGEACAASVPAHAAVQAAARPHSMQCHCSAAAVQRRRSSSTAAPHWMYSSISSM
jgi:hypothetical protein